MLWSVCTHGRCPLCVYVFSPACSDGIWTRYCGSGGALGRLRTRRSWRRSASSPAVSVSSCDQLLRWDTQTDRTWVAERQSHRQGPPLTISLSLCGVVHTHTYTHKHKHMTVMITADARQHTHKHAHTHTEAHSPASQERHSTEPTNHDPALATPSTSLIRTPLAGCSRDLSTPAYHRTQALTIIDIPMCVQQCPPDTPPNAATFPGSQRIHAHPSIYLSLPKISFFCLSVSLVSMLWCF